jgi:hypothetical protein
MAEVHETCKGNGHLGLERPDVKPRATEDLIGRSDLGLAGVSHLASDGKLGEEDIDSADPPGGGAGCPGSDHAVVHIEHGTAR